MIHALRSAGTLTIRLRLKSEITHKSTTEIIGELVREKIAAATE
jgi:hypothetical protein